MKALKNSQVCDIVSLLSDTVQFDGFKNFLATQTFINIQNLENRNLLSLATAVIY